MGAHDRAFPLECQGGESPPRFLRWRFPPLMCIEGKQVGRTLVLKRPTLAVAAIDMTTFIVVSLIPLGVALLAIIYEPNRGLRQTLTGGRTLPSKDGDLLHRKVGGRHTRRRDDGSDRGRLAGYHGNPFTNAARVTEKFRRVNFGTLEIVVTVHCNDLSAYRASISAYRRCASSHACDWRGVKCFNATFLLTYRRPSCRFLKRPVWIA